MRIIITGAKGQLGRALSENLKAEQLSLTDLPLLNLVSYEDTLKYFLKIQPELVIHCAAKTNVDDCELYPNEAYLVNVLATKNIVNACQVVDAVLVYLSTDYVFDGLAIRPYTEYDRSNPINVYGMTKRQGEEIVITHLQKFFIVRTAWLFSDIGHNFIKTVLELAGNGRPLRIINDQIGSPTYTIDLAEAIKTLIKTSAFGIFHITNDNCCSWFEFAREFFNLADKKEVKIIPITSVELNRPALRPHYSVLAKESLNILKIKMPIYQDALNRLVQKLHFNQMI